MKAGMNRPLPDKFVNKNVKSNTPIGVRYGRKRDEKQYKKIQKRKSPHPCEVWAL
jgi:hypothetical protein